MIKNMHLSAATNLARELMDAHGLAEWNLKLDSAKRRAGATVPAKRQIRFSKEHLALYSPQQVRLVVLHEIAHALAGPGTKHGPRWRAICLEIGGDGRATLDPSWPQPAPLWRGTCPRGHVILRYRKTTRPQSCGICRPTFSTDSLLTWRNTRTGEVRT